MYTYHEVKIKMKKLFAIALAFVMLLGTISVYALAAEPIYPDMPTQEWARSAVEDAYKYNLMNGVDGGLFGTGRTITRAEFITVLVRMFSMSGDTSKSCFDDIGKSWAKDYINIAAQNDVVDTGGYFRPTDNITRREMAVMLVRALGYKGIAAEATSYSIPFTDVTEDRGYIVIAYDIGMTNGTTDTTFSPNLTASREEAAAMLVRVYKSYISENQWSHAFYAISSYSQLELAKRFDAVSFGWSRMVYDGTSAYLNTTTSGGNEYYIPSGYASVVNTLSDAGVKLHLSVYMTTSEGLSAMLKSSDARSAAVSSIMDELTKSYAELGRNPYSGVTIDFEGLRNADKENFNAFLSELGTKLSDNGLTLYVAVMPATSDGVYYDGYDYRFIGDIADKVILMAHDYAATDLTGFLNSTYYKTTALTPINSVYYSLRTACDKDSGVQDKSKLCLAISLSSLAWETDSSGKLTSVSPLHPSTATIYSRLTSGAIMGWSDTYCNPYITYTTENGQHIFLWYEDARSVSAKLTLARMLGITSVSVWRLGLIPAYSDDGLYYDVMSVLG
jgi:spore germination protein YaaH